MQPYHANIEQQQGDLFQTVFKVAANLTGHDCRFLVTDGTTTVLTRLTSDETMTLSYDPAETLTVAGVTETGVTTLSPVLTLEESKALAPGTYDYELEDLLGNTMFRGLFTVNAEVSK